MLTVHIRINDAATGKPTPVRLRISGPDGTTYPPFGRVAVFPDGRNEDVGGHLRLGRERWCYIDGTCEVPLPALVPLRFQMAKGFEYSMLDQTHTLGAGQMSLRFAIERWSNIAAEGWESGDSRCHFIATHSALLEAAAEDLAVVNLLACSQRWPSFDGKSYDSIPHITAFSGQSPALERGEHLVAVNTLNSHPVLGSVGMLNSHRIVFPLTFGGDETDDWSVCDWCDQCHRKGGLTVWVDPFTSHGGVIGGEALIAAILGKIDAIEVDAKPRTQPLLSWLYRLWNVGFLIPLVGSSGKDCNAMALGTMRTYSKRLRGDLITYHHWIESVRSGQTFVTNGPILRYEHTVDGRVKASATSLIEFSRLELIRNGAVIEVADATLHESRYSATLEVKIATTEPAWLAFRVTGPNSVFAHSSPIILGNELPPHTDAKTHLARLVEETKAWITEHGRFAQAKSKTHLLQLCDAALARLGASP